MNHNFVSPDIGSNIKWYEEAKILTTDVTNGSQNAQLQPHQDIECIFLSLSDRCDDGNDPIHY